MQEIANERDSDTFNQWSHETLNEFTEESQDSRERMEGNVIWLTETTSDFEENEYRTTNLQNIHETRGKQVENYCLGLKMKEDIQNSEN